MNANNPSPRISCRAAAREVRAILGIDAYGPSASALLGALEACKDPNCSGIGPESMALATRVATDLDAVHALLN